MFFVIVDLNIKQKEVICFDSTSKEMYSCFLWKEENFSEKKIEEAGFLETNKT